MRRLVLGIGLLLLALAGFGALASLGLFGKTQGRGEITGTARDPGEVARRQERQDHARPALGVEGEKQILFGDLHVHTTYSLDAFSVSLPMAGGEGSHPPGDACDFARFCSALDFWSINDHAESLTPHQWTETKAAVRQCNAVAGGGADPDLVTFLGWEWTQIGNTPEDHYGHKNVVLLGTAEDEVPTRPIASRRELFPAINPFSLPVRLALIAAAPGGGGRQPYLDFARYLEDRAAVPPCPEADDVRSLPADCAESASTPTELFARLDQWGFPRLVIPHGNTWGIYTPALSSWDKQLRAHADPDRDEFLIEVFSGHGNIEAYRSWRALEQDADGTIRCPEPRADYLPSCWQAGEIIRMRCLGAGEGEAECERRAAEARSHFVAAGSGGHQTVPGARVEDWLDAGQCRDCYLPAFNYRPAGSVQYALALRDTSDPEQPKRFRFGMLGSSDVHSARPGNGYKEFARRRMSDANLGALSTAALQPPTEPEPRSIALAPDATVAPEFERFSSFFGLGGLVAVHSEGRDRQAIWDALERREVYGTSGSRILLWFDALAEEGEASIPMGSVIPKAGGVPRFEVRAMGAFEQKPGCPADVATALPGARLERLCAGECYHPSDRRHRIDRIEVVRIRPRIDAGEDVAELVEDPWRVLPCPEDGAAGCRLQFDDPSFSDAGRDAVYYVRAHQVATPTVNAANLRCRFDDAGECVEVKPCAVNGDTPAEDDCLAPAEERAWSSPIFVDFEPAPPGSP
jgi:hypothetical protein